jgi:hypothetical protein
MRRRNVRWGRRTKRQAQGDCQSNGLEESATSLSMHLPDNHTSRSCCGWRFHRTQIEMNSIDNLGSDEFCIGGGWSTNDTFDSCSTLIELLPERDNRGAALVPSAVVARVLKRYDGDVSCALVSTKNNQTMPFVTYKSTPKLYSNHN